WGIFAFGGLLWVRLRPRADLCVCSSEGQLRARIYQTLKIARTAAICWLCFYLKRIFVAESGLRVQKSPSLPVIVFL
ncbi:hypothetical protein, partial [Jannaschia faecimaris]|uniref:hypothetical protein n=1 Tax=Jannaschia faecimaris TaxID=1244108 RepID=UPI001B8B74C5